MARHTYHSPLTITASSAAPSHADCLVHLAPAKPYAAPTLCGISVSIAGLRAAGLTHAHTDSRQLAATCRPCLDALTALDKKV